MYRSSHIIHFRLLYRTCQARQMRETPAKVRVQLTPQLQSAIVGLSCHLRCIAGILFLKSSKPKETCTPMSCSRLQNCVISVCSGAGGRQKTEVAMLALPMQCHRGGNDFKQPEENILYDVKRTALNSTMKLRHLNNWSGLQALSITVLHSLQLNHVTAKHCHCMLMNRQMSPAAGLSACDWPTKSKAAVYRREYINN